LTLVKNRMPVVQVSVWAGISKENKKQIVEGITKVIADIGVPREAITIIIYEVPKTDWASGGQMHSEKFGNR
jgi:4-oxalocrotonate tautomerase